MISGMAQARPHYMQTRFPSCLFYCYNRFIEEEGWRGFRDGLGQRGLCTGDFGDGGKGGYCGGVDVIANLEQ